MGFIANENACGGNNAACRGISATATRDHDNAADDGDLAACARPPASGTRENGRAAAPRGNRGAWRGTPTGGPTALRECGGGAECGEREDEGGRAEEPEGRVHG